MDGSCNLGRKDTVLFVVTRIGRGLVAIEHLGFIHILGCCSPIVELAICVSFLRLAMETGLKVLISLAQSLENQSVLKAE